MKRMRTDGSFRRLESVFPPDSDTAWTSIFTGLNPAEHGVVKFVDPLEKSIGYTTQTDSNDAVKGKCIWDHLSENGKKVCVLLPHAAFPPWKVNGLMISRSSATNEVRAVPEGWIKNSELDGLKAPRGFPGKSRETIKKYIEESRRLLDNTKELTIRLLDREDWDFFFVYSPVLDIIPHFFWKFYDKGDPDYPSTNPYEDLIPSLYKEHDAFLGELLRRARERDIVVALSDHGHGRRPRWEFKMNETLRREGFLFSKEKHDRKKSIGMNEWLLRIVTRGVERFGLENQASSMLGRFPSLRKRLTEPSWIDLDRTIAATVDLSGIKSYSYGGVRINTRALNSSTDYERVRRHIINLIDSLRDTSNGKKISVWVKPREEVYMGDHINEFPDILYQLDPEYGFNPRLGMPLIENSRIRSIVPGTHLGLNAVIIVHGEKGTPSFETVTMTSIAKTIETCLGS